MYLSENLYILSYYPEYASRSDKEEGEIMRDIEDFKSTLPYASELFGIYTPLLGWKGLKTREREEDEMVHSTRLLVRLILDYARMNAVVSTLAATPNGATAVLISQDSINQSWQNVVNHIEDVVIEFIKKNNYFPKSKLEWEAIIKEAKQNLDRGN